MFIQNRFGYLFVLWSTSALLYLYSELIVQYYARYIFPLWRLTLIQTYWWTGRKTPTYLLNLLLWRPYGEGIVDKINVLSAENYWLTGRKTQSYLLTRLLNAGNRDAIRSSPFRAWRKSENSRNSAFQNSAFAVHSTSIFACFFKFINSQSSSRRM